MTRWRCVVVESPFAGDIALNLRYLRAAMRDCLRRGEAPFASHGLYTQDGVLDDGKPDERHQGITAGLAWGERADAAAVYTDLGISSGMELAIERYTVIGCPIEYRKLGEIWRAPKLEPPVAVGDIVLLENDGPRYRVVEVQRSDSPHGFSVLLEAIDGGPRALFYTWAWRCRRVPRLEVMG